MVRTAILGTLTLDRTDERSLYAQLYDQLREAILSGRLPPGSRLPSTRTLASDLGASRNTITTAFEQLIAEGYLDTRVGSGTVVTEIRPEDLLHAVRAETELEHKQSRSTRQLSNRGIALSATTRPVSSYRGARARAFQHGLPEVAEFPHEIWARLLSRRARRVDGSLMDYSVGPGYPPLRQAISEYLGAARGVSCTAEQVIVTTGAQAALDLIARLVLDAGDTVWHEEPGYLGARGAFAGAGCQIEPVPVDDEGMSIDNAEKRPTPKLIYTTPSHQFPLGVTMSLARRLALISLADRTGAWILEDDYDSEYRYRGKPLAAMQGLDRSGSVIYMGTFAKTLFPGLRVGYLVAPTSIAPAFEAAVRISGQTPASLIQAALCDFLGDGHFSAHVRRMRALYAERQSVMIDALAANAGDRLRIGPRDAGKQVAAHLPVGTDDETVAAAARAKGLVVTPLSLYHMKRPTHRGLYLGYAGVPETDLRRGARDLALALDECGLRCA